MFEVSSGCKLHNRPVYQRKEGPEFRPHRQGVESVSVNLRLYDDLCFSRFKQEAFILSSSPISGEKMIIQLDAQGYVVPVHAITSANLNSDCQIAAGKELSMLWLNEFGL